MPQQHRASHKGQELISLAQKLARDAERHAILSASLASHADRLMHAGLRLLEPPAPARARTDQRLRPWPRPSRRWRGQSGLWENGRSPLFRKDSMRFRFAAAFGAALLSAACGGLVSPSDNVTETFKGTLEPGGISVHQFKTSKSGEIEIKITELAPVTNVFIGTFYGQPQSDGSCGYSPYQPPNPYSTLNQVAIVGAIRAGNWCVGTYDPARLPIAATYTLTVKHP